MTAKPPESLRWRLLRRLMGPLSIVFVLDAVVAFLLARHFANVVYDRWLYDSAMTLATQVRLEQGHAALDLPRRAVEMFEWDTVDRIFEEAVTETGRKLFANASFPAPPAPLAQEEPQYYDGAIENEPVRIVAVGIAGSATGGERVRVQVAETLRKRNALVRDIILATVPAQLAILALAATLIWYGVRSSLKALDATADDLARYDPDLLVPVGGVSDAPSEIRPLLLSLNQLIARVAESQDVQRRFVANAAHQLRTPLATLQVQTERALREPDPARHREALDHVLTAVTRMRHLVHQLMMLSRSDRKLNGTLAFSDVDLAALARSELERWADEAIARDLDLGYEGPDSGIVVRGDAQLLGEMIGNLVDNAIRYNYSGRTVTLLLKPQPVVLAVADDGPGIPQEERRLVLEPFYRRPGNADEGCGLGLAIAHEIAARHGAALVIQDGPDGRGTSVQVRF
jgi:two-component system sensor histidine kinase TctE